MENGLELGVQVITMRQDLGAAPLFKPDPGR
jgi:hypothetical protein